MLIVLEAGVVEIGVDSVLLEGLRVGVAEDLAFIVARAGDGT